MIIDYIKCPLNKYTFSVKPIRDWVVSQCNGDVLNLFAGKTKLPVNELRIDSNPEMVADIYMDAFDYVNQCQDSFDTIILDPPYAYRKSMEMYSGNKMSRFNALKNLLPKICSGKIITFGYHSVSMGKNRGFEQERVLLLSHGGAIHDTIAVVEIKALREE
jgi:hypothetical protein